MLELAPVLDPAAAKAAYMAAHERLVGSPRRASVPLPQFLRITALPPPPPPAPSRTHIDQSKNRRFRLLNAIVCKHFDAIPKEFYGRERSPIPATARCVSMHIARNHLEFQYTWERIGNTFHRSPATILQAVGRVERRLVKDPNLRNAVALITQQLDDALRAQL